MAEEAIKPVIPQLFTPTYRVKVKATQEMVKKDLCSLAQLGDRMSAFLTGHGIYHCDKEHRFFVPRGTSMPSPLRYDFDLLREPTSEESRTVDVKGVKDIGEVFASFLRQSKAKSDEDLSQSGWRRRWWYGKLDAMAAASQNAEALLPYIDNVVDVRTFGQKNGKGATMPHVLPFDCIVRTGGAAVAAVKKLRHRLCKVSNFATILDLEHGGRQALEDMGVKLYALLTKRDLYCIWNEGMSPNIDKEDRKNISGYRTAPVQFSIDYAFKHRNNLPQAFVPYRSIPEEETLTCMLIRLTYENLALPYNLSESDTDFRRRRSQNYEKLHLTGSAYLGDVKWWPLFIYGVGLDYALNQEFTSHNVGVRAEADNLRTRENVIRNIERRIRAKEEVPYIVALLR